MTERLRAVFDTNVFISAYLSRNPRSPAQELIERWKLDEFVLIFCQALLGEVIEKLNDHQIDQHDIRKFVALVERMAEMIAILTEETPIIIPSDPDDDAIIACAITAEADYLVTHDKHFDVLGGEYQGVKIVKALPFLWAVRGDRPPEQPPRRRSEA
jgi:putative PIN family toxin of toxin-antitoxin system